MARGSRGHSIRLLREPVDRPGRPLYMRLYLRIREAVLDGAMPPGTRLPSARTLAQDEGVSRNTVEAAFRQLQAEGFLTRRVGAGTWISEQIPERLLGPARSRGTGPFGAGGSPSGRPRSASEQRSASAQPAAPDQPAAPVRLSARGRRLMRAGKDISTPPDLLFAPCIPGLDALPLDAWNRIAARLARRASGELLVPPPPGGLAAVREAVAGYVHMARGVRCGAENVVIVNSTQQAIDLVARLLLDPRDEVWMEDPGYVSARLALAASGARLVPVPVDDEGIDVAAGSARAPNARLAYITPSHQYPLGVTLSLPRRLALVDWAERAGSWILEDDYDSELRYAGRPLASVQGIDASGRVIYAGTFNKILFPTLRVAYLVLPPDLVEPFVRARHIGDGFTPSLQQRVLAEFIDEGHFSIHLRKVRSLYEERRDRFLEAASRHLSDRVTLGPAEAGMHVALHLPAGADDRALATLARDRGLAAPALSIHALERDIRGLLLHYGNAPARDIGLGIRRLSEILAGV